MDQEKELQLGLEKIDAFEDAFWEYFQRMIEDTRLFPLDQLAIGVMNRSLSLLYGFATLVRSDNYIGAAHLVRPHLDNYLRFSAAWLVEDAQDFALKVLEGQRIDKLRDRTGAFLKDVYLIQSAKKQYPWMENVYHYTSGFIHLSKKHVFTSSKVIDAKERTIEIAISKTDKYVPLISRLEGIQCMIEITNCIFILLEGWIQTKEEITHKN